MRVMTRLGRIQNHPPIMPPRHLRRPIRWYQLNPPKGLRAGTTTSNLYKISWVLCALSRYLPLE